MILLPLAARIVAPVSRSDLFRGIDLVRFVTWTVISVFSAAWCGAFAWAVVQVVEWLW